MYKWMNSILSRYFIIKCTISVLPLHIINDVYTFLGKMHVDIRGKSVLFQIENIQRFIVT